MAQIKLLGKTNIQGKTIFATDQSPTYTITRSASSVNEGSSITFTLNTTNVANGTVLPYTISGISANDVTSGSLTGSFNVNSGLATTTITMSADQLTEGAETATLTLNNGAASNFVVVNDTSVWTPNLISGLQLWLDASDTSTLYNATAGGSLVTTDGSAVARWADKSGNNNHFTQSTSNARPVIQTNSLNSRNGLLWDGSNDFMSGAITGFKSFAAASVVLVCRPTAAAAPDTQSAIFWGFGNIAGGTNASSSGLALQGLTANLTGEKIAFVADKQSVGQAGRLGSSSYSRTANQPVILTTVLSNSGTAVKQNGSNVSLNLTFTINTSTNLTPAVLGYTADDVFYLGAQKSTNIFSSAQIRFYEALVFNKVLTAQEETNLNSYLNTKWALYQ